MRGLLRFAPVFALFAIVAVPVSPARAALSVRAADPRDLQLSPELRALTTRTLARRLDGWRAVPHLITQPGVDWSPAASRRLGWRASAPTRATFRSALGTQQLAAGPPDTVNVAFIRIEFDNDRDGNLSTGNGRFNLDPADTNANPVDRPPHNRTFYRKHHEALARYYDAMSYGRVIVTGQVWPREENSAYRVSDMADFGPWRFNRDIEGAAVQMFHTMLTAAHEQAKARNDTIPWNSIDRVVVIHAGSDLQSDLRSDSKLDIPSFTLGVSDSNAVIFPDGSNRFRPINRASFVPETQNQDGFYGALNGVLAHECGHLIFGYADLYDFETGFPVVGLWSLMDSGNLAGSLVKLANGEEIFATGLLAPSVDPFHRSFTTDALQIPEVRYGVLDSLRDVERHPEMRLVTLSSDEFLVLENRYQSLAIADSVQLEQDDTTRVVLGPKKPDRYEYDALVPGGGMLIWHIDESVIPLTTSLRPNLDFGVNTNPLRLGVTIVEADGLADIGDLGSPFVLGSYRDPWYVGNNTRLGDDTRPNLIPHIGTRPHVRLEILDTLKATMRFQADREWQLPGWPVFADNRFPPGGPQLLAVDVDGDSKLEVCWAGGDSAGPDSTALLAYSANGTALNGGVIASLPRRPIPLMAALPTGGPRPEQGPALFAATTALAGTPLPGDGTGEVWLMDQFGQPNSGQWPVTPSGSRATTAPIFVGEFPNAAVVFGAADGNLYAYNLDGSLMAKSDLPLGTAITGRLAAWPSVSLPVTAGGSPSGAAIAAGSGGGDMAIFILSGPGLQAGGQAGGFGAAFQRAQGWPQHLSSRAGFEPDFLWLDLDGRGGGAGDPTGCGAGHPELVAHDADRLWAFCVGGRLLPGWGRSFGDTIAAGLGAGDPDNDGFPEVLVQSQQSKVAFVNTTGVPSTGWPRLGSPEGVIVDDTLLTELHTSRRFPTLSPPLALDLDGNGRTSVVALNVSGVIAALRADGSTPSGWPLATGSGVSGAPLAADLDGDGRLDLVAPDRFGTLYGFTLPSSAALAGSGGWTMVGGDPLRSSALPIARTPLARAATTGPIVNGTLKAFPNPARRRPVSIAYTLTEPARVEFRILDTAGLEVASFQRDGRMAENFESWDPGALPAGLYMIHVRIHGARSETSQVLQVGVLK